MQVRRERERERVKGRNLESESEEVHDVIRGGGVLDVAAVDVHRVHELERKKWSFKFNFTQF